jgi:plastocyanin
VFAISALATTTPVYAGGGGCHSQAATDGRGVTVEIKDACFNPTVLHIPPGQKVTWINRDDLLHTVSGTAQSFGTYDQLRLDQSVSYQFKANGVYTYFCLLHPGMTGSIVVGDGTGPGPATGPAAVVALPAAIKTASVKASDPTGLTAATGAVALLLGAGAGYLLATRLRRGAA